MRLLTLFVGLVALMIYCMVVAGCAAPVQTVNTRPVVVKGSFYEVKPAKARASRTGW